MYHRAITVSSAIGKKPTTRGAWRAVLRATRSIIPSFLHAVLPGISKRLFGTESTLHGRTQTHILLLFVSVLDQRSELLQGYFLFGHRRSSVQRDLHWVFFPQHDNQTSGDVCLFDFFTQCTCLPAQVLQVVVDSIRVAIRFSVLGS